MTQKRLIYFIAFISLAAAGCSIHRPDIQQGNVLEPAAVAQLKLGLTKKQVRFIMGDPIIIDPFHPDRWDYIYMTVHQLKIISSKKLTVYFDHDVVSRLDPNDRPQASHPASIMPPNAAPPPLPKSPAATEPSDEAPSASATDKPPGLVVPPPPTVSSDHKTPSAPAPTPTVTP